MSRKKDKLDNLLREYFKAKYKTEDIMSDESFVLGKRLMFREKAAYYKIDADDSLSEPSKIQKKIEPCPKTYLLVEYLEGTLKDDKKSKIDEHIKKCSGCKEKVMTGKDLMQRYKEGKLEEVPEDISTDISRSFNLRNNKEKEK